MASAETSELFHCSTLDFYKIISDYEKYPEFLNEVKSCKIIESKANQKKVEFEISLIKTFRYTLNMMESEGKEIQWVLASGDIFKTSTGFWKLADEVGKCRAIYHVEATFNLFVPSPIAKALVSVNLPTMMSAYHKRVATIYGK